MLKFIMDNLIIVIPCITLLVLFYMYSNKSHEGITNIGLPEDEYNTRVKQVYSLIKPKHRGWVTYE